MASGAGLAAAAAVVATAALLVSLLARIARAARGAGSRALDGASALAAAAAVLAALGLGLRALRYALASPPTLPEVVLSSGASAGAALLLNDLVTRAHRARTGAPPPGARAAGGILLAACLASALLALGKSSLTLQVTVALGVELGALSWALSTLAIHVTALADEPPWVAGLARAGSQTLVAVAFARALLAGPANLAVTRLILGFGVLVAVLLATPALDATARALGRGTRGGRGREPAPEERPPRAP